MSAFNWNTGKPSIMAPNKRQEKAVQQRLRDARDTAHLPIKKPQPMMPKDMLRK